MKKQATVIMKFGALLMAVILFSCLNASAQEQQTSMESNLRPKLGIKAGLNLTNLYVADVSNEHVKAGFNAGLFAKFPVAKGFSIQPELLYSVKGAKEEYNNFGQVDEEYCSLVSDY